MVGKALKTTEVYEQICKCNYNCIHFFLLFKNHHCDLHLGYRCQKKFHRGTNEPFPQIFWPRCPPSSSSAFLRVSLLSSYLLTYFPSFDGKGHLFFVLHCWSTSPFVTRSTHEILSIFQCTHISKVSNCLSWAYLRSMTKI